MLIFFNLPYLSTMTQILCRRLVLYILGIGGGLKLIDRLFPSINNFGVNS